MRRILWLSLFLLGACGSANKCAPGDRGCACIQDGCHAGLGCVDGKCQAESFTGLSVGDANARACEVVIGEKGGHVDRVEFADDVTGRWLRQGDKIAAAFTSNQDARIGAGAVKVAYVAGKDGSFDLLRSHCYGAHGEELANASVGR